MCQSLCMTHRTGPEQAGSVTEFRLMKLTGLSMNKIDQFNRYFLFFDLPKMHYLLNHSDPAVQPDNE
jgi:hypothetical protein